MQNLRENAEYVTYDLAKIVSDQRLQQVAWSLRLYYAGRGVEMPELYQNIPAVYDLTFDYDYLRQQARRIAPNKRPYHGTYAEAEWHRSQAQMLSVFPCS